MYVAGVFADAGWNVYFPRRDKGFDFVVTKSVGGVTIIRPVQVKGKYPNREKTNKAVYGYRGKLTATHEEMVLAIPFFPLESTAQSPRTVAYLPKSVIKKTSRGYRCDPAKFVDGMISPRPYYKKFFDHEGLSLLEQAEWKNVKVTNAAA